MNASILIVDDEPLVLKAMQRQLKNAGYKVVTAENAESAMEQMHHYQCPVILCDYQMPGMNGIQLLHKINEQYSNVIGIVLSGYADFDVLIEMLNAGIAWKFLQKPWQGDTLLETVAAAFQHYTQQKQEQLLTDLLIGSRDALLEVDHQYNIKRFNPVLAELLQTPADILRSSTLCQLFPELTQQQLQELTAPSHASVLLSHQHSLQRLEISLRANTQTHLLLKLELQHEKLPLPLNTFQHPDILNQLTLTEKIQTMLQQPEQQSRLAVAAFEISNFYLLHEHLGAQEADLILDDVARCLLSRLQPDEHLAYLANDKFALLLPCPERETLLQHRFSELLQDLTKTPQNIQLKLNLGYSLAPDDSQDPKQLLYQARMACRQNRSCSANFFMRFDQSVLDARRRRFELSNALYLAIPHQEFHLAFQPQVTTTQGRIYQAEVLLRWNHAKYGAVPPAQFIPIAEHDGQIHQIGDWVLQQSCQTLQRWQQQGLPVQQLAVNISGRQLEDPFLPHKLKLWLAQYQIDPTALELEITETYLMNDIEKSLNILQELRRLGIRLAIDDFGTGYSSLAYLAKLPVHTLKLDRALFQHFESSLSNQSMLRNIIRMAHELDMAVIAEGIETKSQYQLLQEMECDIIQGFLFCKPLTEPELVALLLKQSVLHQA